MLLCPYSYAQITFQKTYGSGGEIFNASLQTADHGFIFVGSTLSKGAWNSDVLVVKIDSVGNQQWSKTYGDTGNDYGNFIVQNQSSNGFVISGYTVSFGAPQGSTYVVKIDSIGNVIWSNIYATLLGSSSNCIVKTSDGGYISTGEINTGNPGNPNSQIYLLKIDSIGNVDWAKSYGGVDFDQSNYLHQTFDGG